MHGGQRMLVLAGLRHTVGGLVGRLVGRLVVRLRRSGTCGYLVKARAP